MADPPARPPRSDFGAMRGDTRSRGVWSTRDGVPSPSGSHPGGGGGGGGGVGVNSRVEGHPPNGLRGRDDELPRSGAGGGGHFTGGAPRNEPAPFNGDRSGGGGGFSREEARLHENPRKRTFSGMTGS